MSVSVDNSIGGKTSSSLSATIRKKLEDDVVASKKHDENHKSAPKDTRLSEDRDMEVEEAENESGNLIEFNEPETPAVDDIAEESESVEKSTMTPVLEKTDNVRPPSNVAVPRTFAPLSTPNLKDRPLVLATHLVPSFPVSLFELLVEAIEAATEKPVVLLHETRPERPVAKDITDIAILPAGDEWENGKLLPVTFIFEHRLNKDKSGHIYAELIVATDRAAHVKEITDLRGHRCALPDRRKVLSAAGLLFSYLHTRGESPSFFGNTLDAGSQVAALQMVAGKQAEVGVLEAPVIHYHRHNLPGVESLKILTSLGPLPPYRIMVNEKVSDELTNKIATYLLNMNDNAEWLDRLAPYGIIGFAKNSLDLYDVDMKNVVTSVPYY